MGFDKLKRDLASVAYTLSKHQLEELRYVLHDVHKERFAATYRSRPKYGTMNTAFSEDEIKLILPCVQGSKFKLLFKLQSCLGYRIGEVCTITVYDINFATRELIITTEKTHGRDPLRIPDSLFNELRQFIADHNSDIARAQGHIFFKENDNNKNKCPHVDRRYAAKVFRQARQKAGLTEIYGYSKETTGKTPRPLYRLGTHSFRRYAGTHFYNMNKDIVLTSRFLRHTNIRETMKYVGNNRPELYRNIEQAFNGDVRQRKLPQILDL